MKLWQQVFVGLILGVIAGLLLGDKAEGLKIFGTIFINLIKMVIVPLIFFALLSGITSIGDGHSLARVSIKGIAIYISTAMFAVCLGLLVATIFKPGIGIDISSLGEMSPPNANGHLELKTFLLGLIPTNPINAMANDHFIQIVIFSIFLGICINLVGDKNKPLKEIINICAQTSFKMIGIIIKLAPVGVFGFIACMVGTQGMEVLLSLCKLILTALFAFTIQYILFGFMIFFLARISPFPFYKKMLLTQSLAFATSSSKATLPTAMDQLNQRLGVSRASVNFLMPLGACLNMDGMAIYLGISAVFFAQAFGVVLTPHDYLILVLTCTLGSIGGAGIPSGSIIFMGMVLNSVGLPTEGIALLLGIDRILDMLRTVVNLTGDATVTVIIDSTEKTLNKNIYYAKE